MIDGDDGDNNSTTPTINLLRIHILGLRTIIMSIMIGLIL